MVGVGSAGSYRKVAGRTPPPAGSRLGGRRAAGRGVLGGRGRPIRQVAPALATWRGDENIDRQGRCEGAPPRWVPSQSSVSRARMASPLVSRSVCDHGPIVSATSRPGPAGVGTAAASGAGNVLPAADQQHRHLHAVQRGGIRIRSQNGSLGSCSAQDSNHGAALPSSARAAAPIGTSAAGAPPRGACVWRIRFGCAPGPPGEQPCRSSPGSR